MCRIFSLVLWMSRLLSFSDILVCWGGWLMTITGMPLCRRLTTNPSFHELLTMNEITRLSRAVTSKSFSGPVFEVNLRISPWLLSSWSAMRAICADGLPMWLILSRSFVFSTVRLLGEVNTSFIHSIFSQRFQERIFISLNFCGIVKACPNPASSFF